MTASPKGQFKRWLTAPPRRAAIALLAGWLAPAPWIIAALMVALLTALWSFVVARMIRAGVWGQS